MSAKQLVLDAIHRLPEDIDLHDIAEEIAFLAATRETQQQIQGGKVISNDEMKRRIDSWVIPKAKSAPTAPSGPTKTAGPK